MKGEPMLKFNTFISSVGAVLVAVIGFLLAEQLHDIKAGLVPRSEHEVRWTEQKAWELRMEADLLEVRARVLKLEEESRRGRN